MKNEKKKLKKFANFSKQKYSKASNGSLINPDWSRNPE